MRLRSLLCLCCFLAAGAIAQETAPPPAGLLIRNVTLIDGNGGAPTPHTDVFIRDGKIAALALPPGASPALTLDGSGLYLTPGLIDAHVHLTGPSWPEVTAQLKKALRGGVTAVFDVAGDTRVTGSLARAQLAGEIESPSIYYVALFGGRAFMSDPRTAEASLGYPSGQAPWMRTIDGDTDVAMAVTLAHSTGAQAIKLYAALDAAVIKRIGAEAQRQNVRLIAHAATFPGKPSDLVNAGVKYLAHAPYLVWEGMPPSADFKLRAKGDFASVPADGPVMTRLLQSMKDNDVALNPTLWIFGDGPSRSEPNPVRTAWMNRITQRAQQMGVTIAAGVDSMTTPDDPLPMMHKELETLVTGAGLTPLQAITAATRGAAHAMGVDKVRGTVAPGMAADLVLVSADPSQNIGNLRQIRYVIKDGALVVNKQP